MPFKPPKKKPEFADLKGILAQTGDIKEPLYQTIQEIIDRLSLFQTILDADIGKLIPLDEALKKFALKSASYITKNDESSTLPNSYQLIAGPGIEFDTSVPNQITITSSGTGYVPMCNGEYPAEIMYVGQSVLMIGFNGT